MKTTISRAKNVENKLKRKTIKFLKRKKIKLTTINMDKLVNFRKNGARMHYEEMFPKNIYKHLWDKLNNIYKGDLITFYICLDSDNKKRFIDYVNDHF